MEETDDVNVDGYCGCFRLDMPEEEWNQPCGGCDTTVKVQRSISEAIHWRGKHWHHLCALETMKRELDDLQAPGARSNLTTD